MVGARKSGDRGRFRFPFGGFVCEDSRTEEDMESVAMHSGHGGSAGILQEAYFKLYFLIPS